jgi:uncharacterized protein (TIGR02646 family)
VIFMPRNAEAPAALSSRAAATARGRATRFFKRAHSERRQELHTFDPRVYAASSVLTELKAMFNGKCVYCESPPGQSQTPIVDHFRPTAGALDRDGSYHTNHYWWLAYEWENLLLVCPDCSQMKGARFPLAGRRAQPPDRGEALRREKAQLLDPCMDDPEAHLIYGDDGFVSSGTVPGKTTIEVLSLNRWWLVMARADAVRAAHEEWERSYAVIARGGRAGDRALERLMSGAKPYAGIRRQFVRKWLASTDDTSDMLDRASSGEVGVVNAQQQELTRQAFEHYEASVKTYTVAPASTDTQDSYYIAARMIRRVEIRNFRVIRELAFDFPAPRGTATPWLMVLGENGSGKSSILKAVTLALVGNEYRDALGIDARRLVTRGARSGSVTVYLTGASEPIQLTFSRDSPDFQCTPAEPQVLLMAYGATRLLPRHTPHADEVAAHAHEAPAANRNVARFANVDNLFDPFVALKEPIGWLMGLDDERFDTVARALKQLLPLARTDRFLRGRHGVEVKAFGTQLSLDQLSDGYQSVLALATDMMQVLVHRWPAVEIAEGIVAIDELEAHLHPSWRLRIVGSLREVFPRLQFLASTHDPLCLRGLDEGEVMVMRRDRANKVSVITDLPSVKGLRIDQLLTSEIFGLNSTSDPEIDDLLSEYRDLRWRGGASTAARKRQTELQGRLDELQLLGRDRRERLVLEAADEYLGAEALLAGTDQRRQLRASTKRRIAEIFAQTGPV